MKKVAKIVAVSVLVIIAVVALIGKDKGSKGKI